MSHFTDPATGRDYEVGPDGTSHWLDDSVGDSPRRPWYRRPGAIAAATGVGGLLLGTALGAGSSGAPRATPSTATTTTVTASAVPPPAVTTTQTVQATRTIRATSEPRTVTVTKTATAQVLAGGGGSGGQGGVYYANCTEARAAGDTPLYRGDPGYRAGLDRDGDGVACE